MELARSPDATDVSFLTSENGREHWRGRWQLKIARGVPLETQGEVQGDGSDQSPVVTSNRLDVSRARANSKRVFCLSGVQGVKVDAVDGPTEPAVSHLRSPLTIPNFILRSSPAVLLFLIFPSRVSAIIYSSHALTSLLFDFLFLAFLLPPSSFSSERFRNS